MGRALVTQNCWHNQPVFSFIVSVLPGLDSTSYLTALVFVAEVSRRSWGGHEAPASSPILPRFLPTRGDLGSKPLRASSSLPIVCLSHLLCQLLQCPNVAAIVDDITVHVLADGFHSQDPTTVKILLRVVETFAKHGNMVRQAGGPRQSLRRCCQLGDGTESRRVNVPS